MTDDRRDGRQFKGAPYQNPRVFPPPSEEAWAEVGVAAPVKSEAAARQQTGRTFRRGLVAAATRNAASTEFTEVNKMVALVNRNDVRAKEMVITPSVAKSWLEKKAPNRNVSPRAVDRYAADMRAGRWQSNGSTIVMGKSGMIIDGQHRLEAIVQADVPVSMLVVSGVDDTAFATIDTGRPRSVSDVLRVMGYANPNVIAAVSRMWLIHQDTGWFHEGPVSISAQEILSVAISKFEDFHTASNAVLGTMKLLRGASGVWSVLWMKFGEIDPVDRDSFFSGLTTGAELGVDSPIFALRRTLLDKAQQKHGRRATLGANVLGAYIIKAWNKYRAHEPTRMIAWRADEDFPIPV